MAAEAASWRSHTGGAAPGRAVGSWVPVSPGLRAPDAGTLRAAVSRPPETSSAKTCGSLEPGGAQERRCGFRETDGWAAGGDPSRPLAGGRDARSSTGPAPPPLGPDPFSDVIHKGSLANRGEGPGGRAEGCDCRHPDRTRSQGGKEVMWRGGASKEQL